MSWERFKGIVDQAGGRANDLYLFHRGEPLLHPQAAEMIGYAQQRGLPCWIHTNATRLTETQAQGILQSGLSQLSFSIDSLEPSTYERDRPPARFEETMQNLERFLILKREGGYSRPETRLQLMGMNPARLDQPGKKTIDHLKALGLNQVVFRQPHNWGGAVDFGFQTGLRERGVACTFPWYALVIYWDGKVGPCPQDFFSQIILGDAGNQSLQEIWNGRAMDQFRRQVFNKAYAGLEPCRDCDRPYRKSVSGVPLEYLKSFIRENLLGQKQVY